MHKHSHSFTRRLENGTPAKDNTKKVSHDARREKETLLQRKSNHESDGQQKTHTHHTNKIAETLYAWDVMRERLNSEYDRNVSATHTHTRQKIDIKTFFKQKKNPFTRATVCDIFRHTFFLSLSFFSFTHFIRLWFIWFDREEVAWLPFRTHHIFKPSGRSVCVCVTKFMTENLLKKKERQNSSHSFRRFSSLRNLIFHSFADSIQMADDDWTAETVWFQLSQPKENEIESIPRFAVFFSFAEIESKDSVAQTREIELIRADYDSHRLAANTHTHTHNAHKHIARAF